MNRFLRIDGVIVSSNYMYVCKGILPNICQIYFTSFQCYGVLSHHGGMSLVNRWFIALLSFPFLKKTALLALYYYCLIISRKIQAGTCWAGKTIASFLRFSLFPARSFRGYYVNWRLVTEGNQTYLRSLNATAMRINWSREASGNEIVKMQSLLHSTQFSEYS